jgi:hypothetical protein
MVRDSTPAEGTGVFLEVTGESSAEIYLVANDFRKAKVPFQLSDGAKPGTVVSLNNIAPKSVPA